MKTNIQKSFQAFWSIFMILLACVIFEGGCATATPDPVKGWKSWNATLQPPNEHGPGTQYYHVDQAIIDDYKNFIEIHKRKYPALDVAEIYVYENESGEHAVRLVIETELREYVEYYLMYDKANVRTKVIKGTLGHQFHI